MDPSVANLEGLLLDEGTTDAEALFKDVVIPAGENGPYLIVITSTDATIDLNTQAKPAITEVRTIVTKDGALKPVYATPLTTMAVGLAASVTDDAASTDELMKKLTESATKVVSALGMGMSSEINIFDTPPLVTDDTDSAGELKDVSAYRAAVAGAASIIHAIQQNNAGGGDSSAVLQSLAQDLGDGKIDGKDVDNKTLTVYDSDQASVIVETDPGSLFIPGTNVTVNQIQSLLASEAKDTGTKSNTDNLTNGQIVTEVIAAVVNTDKDGDGVLNSDDAFPNDAAESKDSDKDGIGNNADTDDDGDGVEDAQDAFPLNAAESRDTNKDGIGDNADPDDDNDGVLDAKDAFPQDATRSNRDDQDNDGWPNGQDPDDNNAKVPGVPFGDTDKDGIADLYDEDDDNDGVPDVDDALPLDKRSSKDTDGDGFGDNLDDDIDGDGVPNNTGGDDVPNNKENRAGKPDAFPFDATESADLDKDGIGDNKDSDMDGDDLPDVNDPDKTKADTDGDGVRDGKDAFPNDKTESLDSDLDGVGNNKDNCKFVPNKNQTDTDGDKAGDACDLDADGDGVPNNDDPAPLDSTIKSKVDNDGDGWLKGQDPDDNDASKPGTPFVDTDKDSLADEGGLQPDPDDDNDGVPDDQDAFPANKEEQFDFDKDGKGDRSDDDDDNDGVKDLEDRFPRNGEESADTDKDGFGDKVDNCPSVPGPQTDFDKDGKGDVCDDDDDNDGVKDFQDAFPLNAKESKDTDGDKIGNNEDLDDDGDGASDLEEAEKGTNPVERDTDRDSIMDKADNCPMVPNSDQTDSDSDGLGDLCDNPPKLAGFYLLDTTVKEQSKTLKPGSELAEKKAAELCGDGINDLSSQVYYIQQKEADLRLVGQDRKFQLSQGIPARINSFGQFNFEQRQEHAMEQGVFVRTRLTFNGTLASAGKVNGSAVEEVSLVRNSNGSSETLLTCKTSFAVLFSPMDMADSAATLDAKGLDGGFTSTAGERHWKQETQGDELNFGYFTINTLGDSGHFWDAAAQAWKEDDKGDNAADYRLTLAGWVQAEDDGVVNITDAGVVFAQADSLGNVLEKWQVHSYKAPAASHAMDQLVDKLWVEAGLKNPDARFTQGSVLAIEAVSLMDTYTVDCGDMPLGDLACDNGLAMEWTSAGKPVFADAFDDMVQPVGSTMTQPGQGIWMAHSPMGEIYAYILGPDVVSLGSTGAVAFYVQKMDGDHSLFSPLKNAAGVAVMGEWTITQPYEANGQQLLMVKMPEYLKNTFGADDNDGMFLAVIPDTSDSMPYLRIGHYQGAGRVHRESGLNQVALEEVLDNFDYQLPLDSDSDGVPDDRDAFPTDPKEQFDSDKDGVGDHKDAFPFNPQEQADNDHDGMGDKVDLDDDNDSIPDATDTSPFTPDSHGSGPGPVPVGDAKLGGPAYGSTCESCHGSQGKGTGLAPALFPLKSEYLVGDKKLVLEALIGPHVNKPEQPMLCDQTCALNITAYLRGLQGNGTVDGDFDGDGIKNSLDDDDDNDDIKDSEDSEPFTPSKPLDSDKDGVPDDKDAFPLDPKENKDTDGDHTGDNADLDDDNDGTADSEDDDDDGDGIKDTDETDPGTGPNLPPVVVADHDTDGVADWSDNCVIVPNADQADTDRDGLGDACELPDVEVAGLYLVTQTPEADSQIPDEAGTACVADTQVQMFWVDSKQLGSQVYMHRRDNKDGDEGDKGIWLILDNTAAFTLGSKESFSLTEGAFDTDKGTFSFMMKESETIQQVEGVLNCVRKAQVEGELPAPAAEQPVLDAGVHWMDGELHPTADGKMEFTYTWGEVKTGALETLKNWDASTQSFTASSNAETRFFLTADGVKTVQDLVMITGFGPEGEGAQVTFTQEGLAVNFGLRKLDLAEFDLDGAPMEPLLNPVVAMGVDDSKHFPEGAKAYQATLALAADSYEFDCEHSAGSENLLGLNCQNLIPIGWQEMGEPTATEPTAAASGEAAPPANTTAAPAPSKAPIPATQLDDVIATFAEVEVGSGVGIWIGSNSDYRGEYQISAQLASLNGKASDANILAVFRLMDGMGNTQVLAKYPVTKVEVGESTVLELGLPDAVKDLLPLGDDEDLGEPILFTESTLEEGPMVRHGHKRLANSPSHALLYNQVAIDAITTGFAPKLPEYIPEDPGTAMDSDHDGVPDDKDAFPNDPKESADMDKDGLGNNADPDTDGDGTPNTEDSDDDNDGLPDYIDTDDNGDGLTDDTDHDGTPDSEDSDDDGDGIPDVDDTGVEPQPPAAMDWDKDGVADDKDNCPLIGNPAQEDSDSNGLGDVCDKVVPQLASVYLTESFPAEGSQMWDESTKACVTDTQHQSFFMHVEQTGNQVWFEKGTGTEDDSPSFLVGIIHEDGKVDLMSDDPDFKANNGALDPQGNLSFFYTHAGQGCPESALVTAEPAKPVNEGSALASDSINWFDMESVFSPEGFKTQFTYGEISTQAAEMVFTFDHASHTWLDTSAEHHNATALVTDAGLVMVDDLMIIKGFGPQGEGAQLAHTHAGQALQVPGMDLQLGEFDIAGLALAELLQPEMANAVPQNAVFPAGAKAWVAHLTTQASSAEIYCDEDYDPWFTSHLDCDNLVAKEWSAPSAGQANEPVPATSLDDVISTKDELAQGKAVPIWIANGHDASGGITSIQGYFISSDGSLAGIELNFIPTMHSQSSAAPQMLPGLPVQNIQKGGKTLLAVQLPEDLLRNTDWNQEASGLFVTEEAELDGMPLVRHGALIPAGQKQQHIVFNINASDSIIGNFQPVPPANGGPAPGETPPGETPPSEMPPMPAPPMETPPSP